MDIAKINDYHQLRDLTLPPSNLLLDPNNPRISVDLDEKEDFSEEELLSESLQHQILKKINKSEHHVKNKCLS